MILRSSKIYYEKPLYCKFIRNITPTKKEIEEEKAKENETNKDDIEGKNETEANKTKELETKTGEKKGEKEIEEGTKERKKAKKDPVRQIKKPLPTLPTDETSGQILKYFTPDRKFKSVYAQAVESGADDDDVLTEPEGGPKRNISQLESPGASPTWNPQTKKLKEKASGIPVNTGGKSGPK